MKGYGAPPGYVLPTPRYRVGGNVRAHAFIVILNNDPTDYDGDRLELRILRRDGTLAPVQFFYFIVNPTPVPPGAIGINITGLVTLDAIAGKMAEVLTAYGFQTDWSAGQDEFSLFQPFPGAEGNVLFEPDSDLEGDIQFNGQDTFETKDLFFFDGQSAAVPARFGRNLAMLLGPAETPSWVPGET